MWCALPGHESPWVSNCVPRGPRPCTPGLAAEDAGVRVVWGNSEHRPPEGAGQGPAGAVRSVDASPEQGYVSNFPNATDPFHSVQSRKDGSGVEWEWG